MKTPAALLVCAALSAGCGGTGLGVEPVALSLERPSQVAVYVAVASGDEPLTDLSAASFTLYEDGHRLDPGEVKLSLLDRDAAAAHRTLLLLDAGSLSAQEASALSKAAASFARAVQKAQPVSVYAFYSSARLEKIADLPRDPSGAQSQAVEVAAGRGDASRDLNGAVLLGLEQLAAELGAAEQPVRLGTLVVVTRGPDLAGRVPVEQLDAQLGASRASLVAVGVGEGSTPLHRLGPQGAFRVASFDGVGRTLEQAAARVDALYRGRYLVAYCSPARAGERKLRVEARSVNVRGTPISGSLETRFDATGFTAGCQAPTRPRFLVTLVGGRWGWIPAMTPEAIAAAEEPAAEADDKEKTDKEAEATEKTQGEKPKSRARRSRASSAPPVAKPAAPAAQPPAGDKPPPGQKPPRTDFEP